MFIAYVAIWGIFSIGFYGYTAAVFFEDRNDCRKQNTEHWVAHLLMVIEALLFFLVLCAVGCLVCVLKAMNQ